MQQVDKNHVSTIASQAAKLPLDPGQLGSLDFDNGWFFFSSLLSWRKLNLPFQLIEDEALLNEHARRNAENAVQRAKSKAADFDANYAADQASSRPNAASGPQTPMDVDSGEAPSKLMQACQSILSLCLSEF